MTLEVYDTREALIEAAASRIESELKAALNARDRAGFILSGGSTPGPVYEKLSRIDLDWQRVLVGLADERWVEPDHAASNEALIARTLLQDKAANAAFFPMKMRHATAELAVDELNERYQVFDGAIDVLVLGMGPDGHSLSWFPDADGLEAAMDASNPSLVASIMAKKSHVTGDNLERMTLTAKCVAQARHVLLLMTGDNKKTVLENGSDDLPIRTVEALSGGRFTVMWAA